MPTPQENLALATDTADALLNAIKDAAAKSHQSSSGLESLARAYALVRDAMPRESKGRGVTVM